MTKQTRVRAYAPGRVNLIGDHTDYTGGFVLPMAINRGTTIEFIRGGDTVELTSATEPIGAAIPLDVAEPASVEPFWARYVAAVITVTKPAQGGTGTVSTTLPVASGLSSSAAFEVAAALALGFEGTPLELALACQEAEHRASGVPCGIMDQLASATGVEGRALFIDCTSMETRLVTLPDDVEVIVVNSGQARELVDSAYAERRDSCEAAAAIIGPLRKASMDVIDKLGDPILQMRARHVISENQRVLEFVDALEANDLGAAGKLMTASHNSLRDDFEVSTSVLDALVTKLNATPGVFGARLTGAGFGGCVVALASPDSPVEGWRFRPGRGAYVENLD